MTGFGTVIFDCDSTLAAVEGIDELAGPHRAEIERLTRSAMAGRRPLEAVYGPRLALARPGREALEALGRRYVEMLAPDAAAVVAALRRGGVAVRILSGGFAPAVRALGRSLGLEETAVDAVDIRFDDAGGYAGFDEASPLAREGGKAEVVRRLLPRLARPVMLVGDGATDLEASPVVDLFVAYAGIADRPTVTAAADVVVRSASLAPVLCLALDGAPPDARDRALHERGRALLDTDVVDRREETRGPTTDRTPLEGDGMTELPEFGRFFLPGPTEVRPEILEAQVGPMMGHRTREMEALVQEIQPTLQRVFQTRRPVYIAPSSGTGLMEAAVRNCGRRRVLALVNGAFSDRFARIAVANGLEVERLEVDWGSAHDPEQVERAMAGGDFDAVTVVHSETSTGVLNPIEELARAVHARGDALLLVDTVSSAGGAPIHADRWGLDFVLTASQKALALPPGLAFGVAQPAALDRARSLEGRGVYFDFLAFEKNLERDQTPNTPAVSLLYALAEQMRRIRQEGIEARWRRHAAMAERTWAWVDEMTGSGHDMAVVAPPGYRSPTVTCIRVPAGWTGTSLCAAVQKRGYTMAPGYGRFRDEMFRIGHMGDHSPAELEGLLGVIEELLDEGAS